MFDFRDLFQWERFITPSIIKLFYLLAVVIVILYGLAAMVASLFTMAVNPFAGMVAIIGSLLGSIFGIFLARIMAEFILIVFRINEHLGTIRSRGDM